MANNPESSSAIPPREWIKSDADDEICSLSTLYSWWDQGIGPKTVKIGGKRLVTETRAEFVARKQAEQAKAA